MKSKRYIKLPASDVRKLIKDLSLFVVSMDRIGSTFYDDEKQREIEEYRYFSRIRAFKILAKARRILSEAYDSQSPKVDVRQLDDEAENLPYWKPSKKQLSELKGA